MCACRCDHSAISKLVIKRLLCDRTSNTLARLWEGATGCWVHASQHIHGSKSVQPAASDEEG